MEVIKPMEEVSKLSKSVLMNETEQHKIMR